MDEPRTAELAAPEAESRDRLARLLEGRGIARTDPHVNRGVNSLIEAVRAASGLAVRDGPREALLDAANTALRQWHGMSNERRAGHGKPLEVADDEEAVMFREVRQTIREAIRGDFPALADKGSREAE